ncbi:MAG: DUF1592 domain-containing protein [Akkermansiaceae bacterium]|nr:DUF1592 domain-containing protein [Armatimonadota bacterium]
MSLRDTNLNIVWASGGVLLAAAVAVPGLAAKPPAAAGAKTTAKMGKPVGTGEQVFRQQCAPCHGKNGEGAAAYSRPLAGDKSPAQLAKYIAQAMPPGPKHTSLADAEKVAPYIYDTFYSPLAQERNRPARVALSRLTVRQLKNAVSDIVGGFRASAAEAGEPGLRAQYYKGKHTRKEELAIERVDKSVAFNFGTFGPGGGEFDPHQFSIRWEGSVTAPDTGVYEMVVRTEHSTRLWVNDLENELIDGSVRSGKDSELRASIYLVGGRVYPLRLEFSKSTRGVDDSDKKKGKPAPKAGITLAWKRPNLPEEPIPASALRTGTPANRFVLTTPFPPDDRSMGYERGNSVSKEWDDAATSAALETADYVLKHLKELAGTDSDPAQLRTFCKKFVERALRRPLDADTEQRYVEKQFAAAPDTNTAIKRVVLLTLKSPRFLYRELGAATNDPYDTASRLSFSLWDSIPDDALLEAAKNGKLATREQVAVQAERMVADNRAWYKQREFLHQWLKIDHYPDLAKDNRRFPKFTPAAAADLRTSLDLTLENVVRSEKSDFRELLLSNKYYLNGRLAPLYGVSLPADAPFQAVPLDPKERAGVLTHPYLLASFAYRATSSPIHRGVLLTRSVMGRTLSAPPAAFVPLAADLHPKLTTRQRVVMQTKPDNCMSCHSIINPLGFALERFDAIGRFRTAENGSPIDAAGGYESKAGKTVKFTGARDLAQYVAQSDEAQAAFVEKFFQFQVKQPIRAYGPKTLPQLRDTFAKNEFSIRRLAVEIATESALPKTTKVARNIP